MKKLKKWWKNLEYWKKGGIIGLIFVMVIYIPVILNYVDGCKPKPCGEVCVPERPPVNQEKCKFWSPIFQILFIVAVFPFLPLITNSNLTYFMITSFLYILYSSMIGYLIGRFKNPQKTKDKVSKSFKIGIIVYLISVVLIFVSAKVHNDIVQKEVLNLSYILFLLIGSLSIAVFFFIIAFIISFTMYWIKEKK